MDKDIKKLEETGENIIHFKIRTFVSLVAALVIGTNVVNTVIHNIAQNEEEIKYNDEANKRRRQHLEEKIEYKYQISELEAETERLKEELDKCEN